MSGSDNFVYVKHIGQCKVYNKHCEILAVMSNGGIGDINLFYELMSR